MELADSTKEKLLFQLKLILKKLLNNLEAKKVKVFTGLPLSDGNSKAPHLEVSGNLYETPKDEYGRGFVVSPMYEDPYLHELHFDLDDILAIKGKNIYLKNNLYTKQSR